MIASNINYDGEDEDVVIEGSELHEALSKMGYLDYEVVPLPNSELPVVDGNKPALKLKSDAWVSQILQKKVSRIYRYMIKDSKALRQQLIAISEAQHLLDDHAEFIKNLLDENGGTEISRTNKFLQCLQYAAVATVGYFWIRNRSNYFSWLLSIPALTAARFNYTKWQSNRNLKKLISEQTELHYTYKRALRILNHSFRMNNSAKHLGSKFTDLGSEKLKFLQPITEEMLRSLGRMSKTYYETTLKMGKLLPDSCRQELNDKVTYFESFKNCGEVTYDSLKQLFYRFILIQSEMLITLAVLRHNESDSLFEKLSRGMKLDYNVEQLVKLTNKHRISIRKLVDDFNDHKLPTMEDKYRGFPGSKWQDLYVRVHLTSHKIRKAYDNVTSVLEEIENHLDKGTDETELLETLKTKLNDVCNEADKARDLAQLSALIVTKMGGAHGNRNQPEIDDENNAVQISQRELPVVKDTDPEIIDEVFEEYIKERYSEILRDKNGDDYLEGNYKLDKLLSKNLMSELKDALVDKKKDTKERESRALKRMNKNTHENTSENLSSDSEAEIEANDSRKQVNLESTNGTSLSGIETVTEKLIHMPMPPPPPPPLPEEFDKSKKESRKIKVDVQEDEWNRRFKSFVPLPSTGPIPMPLFLSNNEETFIGSGENSGEEVVGDEEENEDGTKL